MNPKEATLVALHEFEQTVKASRLPCLIIVGLPDEQQFIRFSGGMESEATG